MTNEKLFELLKKETNMTESDIMKHIEDGIMIYKNNADGFSEFRENAIEGMNDEEDIPEMWDGLDVVGDYKMDFLL